MTVTDESRLSQATALLRSLGICTAAALLSAGMLYSLFFLARLSFLWGLYPAPFAAAAVAALLLAAFGAAASMMVVRGRTRDATDTTGKFDSVPSPNHAGRAAGWPQSAMAVLFSAPAATVLLVFWPHWNTPALSNGFAGASATLLFATPWVIATRAVGAIGEERLPEVEALRALLWLPALVLFAEAAVLVIASLGLGNQAWAQIAIAVIILVVCAELAVRAIGARFLPPPTRDNAKAQISSVVAQALSSRSLSPVGVAIVMRSQFGMDFSRSWALHFVRSASIPIILLMVGICWFLTGITRVDLNQRGSYERFGYPVAMLTSGLHIVLPWPFGVVRHQELGDVHEVMISNTPVVAGNDHSTAEGPAPASANRLWDSEQPSDVSYLIASGTADRQSFETVSASLRVLYRVGLTDAAARDALYRETDAKGLVRALAGRVLASYFASRTLPQVLGENQAVMASDLKRNLQGSLASLRAGIEVLGIIIETIHPPAGAAPAYRNVQAAEVQAATEIASEKGRAEATLSTAKMQAETRRNEATGAAAQIESGARVDLTNMQADDGPYRAAPAPFMMERYFAALKAVLPGVPLAIVDNPLGGGLSTIDLRPPGSDRLSTGIGREP